MFMHDKPALLVVQKGQLRLVQLNSNDAGFVDAMGHQNSPYSLMSANGLLPVIPAKAGIQCQLWGQTRTLIKLLFLPAL
ncbi:hypothetical protein A3709_13830 [Halioglobus sp. HI00S01]|nr:hypothetical protein A3709_13830 [Halioglobus sp. HI00S01]